MSTPQAERLLADMLEDGRFSPDAYSYSATISALDRGGQGARALQLFAQMQACSTHQSVHTRSFTTAATINAYAPFQNCCNHAVCIQQVQTRSHSFGQVRPLHPPFGPCVGWQCMRRAARLSHGRVQFSLRTIKRTRKGRAQVTPVGCKCALTQPVEFLPSLSDASAASLCTWYVKWTEIEEASGSARGRGRHGSHRPSLCHRRGGSLLQLSRTIPPSVHVRAHGLRTLRVGPVHGTPPL